MNRKVLNAAALVPLMIVAAVLRGAIAFNGGFWRDEALFLAIVRENDFQGIFRVLHFHESHPPLFFALMRLWLTITGDTDAHALLLVILLGVALVPVVFFVGRQLYSTQTGLIAAALAAVVPALNEYSAEVRPYSLLALLALLSCWLLVLALERDAWRFWGGYALSTIALVYTHNWTWLVVAGQLVATAIFLAKGRKDRAMSRFARPMMAFVAIALAYLPWLPILVYQSAHAGHPPREVDGIGALVLLLPTGIVRAIQSTLLPPVKFLRVLVVVAIAAFATLIFLIGKRALGSNRAANAPKAMAVEASAAQPASVSAAANNVFLTVSIVATCAATFLSLHSDMLQPRCFSMLTPLLLLPVADAIARLWNRSAAGSTRRLIVTSLVGVLLLDYGVRLNFLIRSPRSNADVVATAVSSLTEPADLLIIGREWLASSFNHYYTASNDQVDFPDFGRETSGNFADTWQRVADPRALERVRSEISAARKSGRRIWLILDHPSLQPLSALDRREADQGDYTAMAAVRAKEIEKILIGEYGSAREMALVTHNTPRYEDLHAFLFTPH